MHKNDQHDYRSSLKNHSTQKNSYSQSQKDQKEQIIVNIKEDFHQLLMQKDLISSKSYAEKQKNALSPSKSSGNINGKVGYSSYNEGQENTKKVLNKNFSKRNHIDLLNTDPNFMKTNSKNEVENHDFDPKNYASIPLTQINNIIKDGQNSDDQEMTPPFIDYRKHIKASKIPNSDSQPKFFKAGEVLSRHDVNFRDLLRKEIGLGVSKATTHIKDPYIRDSSGAFVAVPSNKNIFNKQESNDVRQSSEKIDRARSIYSDKKFNTQGELRENYHGLSKEGERYTPIPQNNGLLVVQSPINNLGINEHYARALVQSNVQHAQHFKSLSIIPESTKNSQSNYNHHTRFSNSYQKTNLKYENSHDTNENFNSKSSSSPDNSPKTIFNITINNKKSPQNKVRSFPISGFNDTNRLIYDNPSGSNDKLRLHRSTEGALMNNSGSNRDKMMRSSSAAGGNDDIAKYYSQISQAVNFQSESATTRPSSNLTNAKNSPSKLANYKDKYDTYHPLNHPKDQINVASHLEYIKSLYHQKRKESLDNLKNSKSNCVSPNIRENEITTQYSIASPEIFKSQGDIDMRRNSINLLGAHGHFQSPFNTNTRTDSRTQNYMPDGAFPIENTTKLPKKDLNLFITLNEHERKLNAPSVVGYSSTTKHQQQPSNTKANDLYSTRNIAFINDKNQFIFENRNRQMTHEEFETMTKKSETPKKGSMSKKKHQSQSPGGSSTKKKKQLSIYGEENAGALLESLLKNNALQELKNNPNAKFLMLRKNSQKKKGKEDDTEKSLSGPNGANNLKSGTNWSTASMSGNKIRKASDKIVNEEERGKQSSYNDSNGKELRRVFDKTQKLLEIHKLKENKWRSEKTLLLKEIEYLQAQLGYLNN